MTEKKTIKALEEAYRAVFQHLLVHKRKPSTFEEYRIAYAKLCDFYHRHRVSSYDPVVSEMFRRHILRQYENGMLSLNYRRLFIRLSVYVDNYFEGRILTARNPDSRITERCCKLLLMDCEPSAHYRQMLDDYRRYLSSAMSEAKAEYRISKAKLLLRYMEEDGKAGLEDLSIADLADFYAAAIASGESYTALKSYIDMFLEYSGRGDLSGTISMKMRRNREILPAFTVPEVNMMLLSIDRGTDEGKRDFAMIMLAACTGIRGCDIVSMTLDDVDLERKTVSFRQKKTGVRVTLPITDQAAAATADYIRSGRPETASTTLFVSHRYPYGAIPHISSVFYPIMRKAGIDKTKGDKKGFHSFRRMLGGLLLESGADCSLISQILGHSDTSTVARYMPFGMAALEICVMDLPSMDDGKEAGL